MIAELIGFTRRDPLGHHQARRPAAPLPRHLAAPTTAFGFRASTPFEDGLRRTIEWYRAQRELAESRAE